MERCGSGGTTCVNIEDVFVAKTAIDRPQTASESICSHALIWPG